MKKSENKKISAKKMISTIEKAIVKKTIKKKIVPKKDSKKKTNRVSKSTDPRMAKLQERQKKLAIEEFEIKAQIKKEQQSIKSSDAKCMSNAKNLNKHVLSIKAGIAEYTRVLKGATGSDVVATAEEKLIAKIALTIDAVKVVSNLKLDVLRLIAVSDEPDEFSDDFDL